ncbi:MAG: PEP-CTERM sorting domain-containing protein, partial [Gemmatimonadota bacterium]
SGDDAVSRTTRRSEDWHQFVKETNEWGWPRYEFGRERRNDGRAERPAMGDEPRRNEGLPDRENNDRRFDGEWPPESPPAQPDIIDQPGTLTPEPSTLLLISTGIPIAVAVVRRTRRR